MNNKTKAGKNNVICPPCGENVGLPTKRGANRECLVWPLLPRLMAVLLSALSSLRSVGMRNIGGEPHAIPRITGQRGDGACGYGFTLIELLVVILIIGILAAVALPQYQKAVEKTRAASAIQILSSIKPAIDMYILENGFPDESVTFISKDLGFGAGEELGLDIDIRNNLSKTTGLGNDWYHDNFFQYLAFYDSDEKNYVLGVIRTNQVEEETDGIYQLGYFRYSNEPHWKSICYYVNDFGKSVCTSLGNEWAVESLE